MKIIADFFKFIIIAALAAVVAAVGCLSAVFFFERENPQEIFVFGYALAANVNESGTHSLWLIEKAQAQQLQNGDGVVYFDGSYCSANSSVSEYETDFYVLDGDEAIEIAVNDENLVGKVLAMWQF